MGIGDTATAFDPRTSLLLVGVAIASALIAHRYWGFQIPSFGSELKKKIDESVEKGGSGNNKETCCGGGCKSESIKKDTSEDYQAPEVKIIYSGLTGTANKFANEASQRLVGLKTSVMDIVDYDPENLTSEKNFVAFIISSYNVEAPYDWFLKWLEDARHDWRVGKGSLVHLKYVIFGLGDSAYSDEFNQTAIALDQLLKALGATRIYYLGQGDKNADQQKSFDEWISKLAPALRAPEPAADVSADAYVTSDSEAEDAGSEDEMVDLEDMGKVAKKLGAAKKQRDEDDEAIETRQGLPKRSIGGQEPVIRPLRDMVNPMLHKSLTKQGYKIVGTHSGVKMCRWTKAALRGRGYCYKHAFYGIKSHLCMETTPSLACANKCVFCWRHHTNPVGTEWRWNLDDPQFILEGAMQNHYQMIKQMRGVPGVLPERFEEAFQIRHCALSLVGEPIMYPHINEFVQLLHSKRISSFLVTNAQFPDKITSLVPITQLYVSVDAATKESLKKVDRPLFRDFWERFLDCLDALATKGQRTVYRLTLVKAYNTDEIANYVELIRRGRPDFIEVKGVTFCGFGASSGLTMENVPYHNEVIHFVEQIQKQLGDDNDYEISCEHAHSVSVLLTHKKFKREDGWYTWIDYDRFHDLAQSGEHFTALDYCAKTPGWALFGSEEQGFAPSDTRHYRKRKA
ncbi:Fe-S oxidoreductase [Entomophthora muscae]|uniref:Fe-S oxidoreductase n=1 Tax=Entomophthora muscae TaxID=34485 RepID=A0ACC2RP38_9FUNG|nr:Fe-S oxidoreductase [Entomophthora muscae]